MQRASLRAELSVASAFCFDTETTGIDPHRADFFFNKTPQAYCVILPEEYDESTPLCRNSKHSKMVDYEGWAKHEIRHAYACPLCV